MMKVGYFADGPWSHRALQGLLADETVSIAFVCARNDAPDQVLRGMADSNGLEFLVHPNINSEEFRSRLAAHECDLLVSMSFNQIFKTETLALARTASINCHAGKLPFYRGRNILNWALINDEPEFGITVHHIDAAIDTGDIIVQRVLPISDEDTYSTLLERSYEACAEVLLEAVKAIQSGHAPRVKQSTIHPTGSYCVARRLGDEMLDWNQPSRAVFNFIRAICRPGPEARTFLGPSEVRINRSQWIPEAPPYLGVPGAVLRADASGLLVKTGDSFLLVTEWSSAVKVRAGDRFECPR